MELEFLLIDVFTDQPFGGSRLYLFPDGAEVAAQIMQKLAMEMGAGETAFIVPPKAAGLPAAGLRVFTPSGEIPFGGHSVLGATFALDELGRSEGAVAPFTWELEAGRFSVERRREARTPGLLPDAGAAGVHGPVFSPRKGGPHPRPVRR